MVLAKIFNEWVAQYGETYPLYGKETVRHDISGSVRPVMWSTMIAHESLLAERSGVKKALVVKILTGELEFVDDEIADRLLTAMDRADVWYNELLDF